MNTEHNAGSCRYCGQAMNWLYPDESVPYVRQWGHVSIEDARTCVRPDGVWPHPEPVVVRYPGSGVTK